MKLASYVAGGKECYGVVVGDGVVTMKGHALAARRAGGRRARRDAQGSGRVASPTTSSPTSRFLPVIPNPHKILCAGVNYKSHAAEVGRELPKQPSMFIRFTDTLVGHEGEMIRPKLSDNFDFEGELTMVIGKGGRHIPIERALGSLSARYTCFTNSSVHDYKKFSVTSRKTRLARTTRPWIVTADEIPDPTRLTLTTPLNGQTGAALQHRRDDLLNDASRSSVLLGVHRRRTR